MVLGQSVSVMQRSDMGRNKVSPANTTADQGVSWEEGHQKYYLSTIESILMGNMWMPRDLTQHYTRSNAANTEDLSRVNTRHNGQTAWALRGRRGIWP